jgi:hypothetical protein
MKLRENMNKNLNQWYAFLTERDAVKCQRFNYVFAIIVKRIECHNIFLHFQGPWNASSTELGEAVGNEIPLAPDNKERGYYWREYYKRVQPWIMFLPHALNFPALLFSQDFSLECGICYAYRLDNAIPESACDDPRCAQPFHTSCLYEVGAWATSFPGLN